MTWPGLRRQPQDITTHGSGWELTHPQPRSWLCALPCRETVSEVPGTGTGGRIGPGNSFHIRLATLDVNPVDRKHRLGSQSNSVSCQPFLSLNSALTP